ncbi:hypothetical protein GQ53DRAFT_826688 [Thozetella sp. PMI_491]|nr:hypothetical protein GQ53DRAFT_826688 [Thozetella sp. PMI_491]
MPKRLRYQPVTTAADEGDEDSSSLSSASTRVDEKSSLDGPISGWSALYLAVSTLCLFASITFFIQSNRYRVTDERCMRRMSAPSPVLEAVRYEWTNFNQVFQPDVYSGYPSAASEAAWASLWDFGAFSVPLDSLAGLNKSSLVGDFRLVDAAHGGGVGGLLEGAHQIHCLNLVRQFIYRDHWDYSHLPSFSGGEKTRREHVDHCIATLRTVITCNSDVTPYVMQRSALTGKTRGRVLPHKCRVYSGMVDWVKAHSVFDTVE